MENLKLNVSLLRRRVPNLTSAARTVGLRSATVSNLCTGKIPVARAEVRTLVALATLAECSLDELIIREEMFEMVETGIKVLDLFAPLAKGGTAGLVARPGMGQLVVFAEIFHNLKEKGYESILLKPQGDNNGVEDILQYADVVCDTPDEVFNQAVQKGKSKDIILAADRSSVVTNEIYDLLDRLRDAGFTSVTTLLVDLKGDAVDEDLPYGPLETFWKFDAELVSRYSYPAINPIQSTSTVLEGANVDQQHQSLQQRARKVLRRYRELRFLVQSHGMDKLPEHEVQTYKRGERLEAYLSQPFFVAEAFTGTKGATVPLKTTLQDVQKILDGSADHKEVDQLKYVGAYTS